MTRSDYFRPVRGGISGLCEELRRMTSLYVRSQCSARVRTSARYHGYGAYFTFLWHNWFYNILPDPSLGLGLARETTALGCEMIT